MSSKNIKKVLAAKGYQLVDLQLQRGNAVCETEWLFLVPKDQQEKILALNSVFFCNQDFSDGYLGGNAEYLEECLDELPNLKENHHV